MAKLKYKDKDGFWQELPVGTNVVANPMLTGTEQELTSLQVGDTKYKMPASGGVQFVELYGGRPLTEEQLTTLKANKSNQIIFYGGEKYYFKLAYEKSSTEWVYATFINSATTLTVNMTTGSATFHAANGGKTYRHQLRWNGDNGFITFEVLSSLQTPITNDTLPKFLYDLQNNSISPDFYSIAFFTGNYPTSTYINTELRIAPVGSGAAQVKYLGVHYIESSTNAAGTFTLENMEYGSDTVAEL